MKYTPSYKKSLEQELATWNEGKKIANLIRFFKTSEVHII